MAYTQEDLQAVSKAVIDLATGRRVTMVQFSGGHMVQYEQIQLEELRALETTIARQLAAATRPRTRFFRTSKGL